MSYQHSVFLDTEKCKGCTHCMRRCPTEAIRIRDGRAIINSLHCIDCGECIRVCPYKAKRAVYDFLADIPKDKFKIALPAPTLFGQFQNMEDADFLVQGLIDMGFDDVYEVSKAAEIVTDYTRQYMKEADTVFPLISSACPVVVRLINIRFPSLKEHVIPVIPPIELAGKLAKERVLEEHPELSPEDVITVFISPCPAKVSWVKNKGSREVPAVDYLVSISEVYFKLLSAMDAQKTPDHTCESGMVGLGWASSGGEGSALMNDRFLAADGIENVINVLDNIETGSINDVDFVELNACSGGCVGGVLTVENPYIAKGRLRTLKRYMPVSRNHSSLKSEDPLPEELKTVRLAKFENVSALNLSRSESFRMMAAMQSILAELPALDCGSCGAPTCRAFAEDVVRGEADLNECIFRMREQLKHMKEKDS